MILDNLIGLLYILSISGQLTLSIVVYYCPSVFFVFCILIVLIVRTSYSLYRAPIVRPLPIVSNYRHSFCLVCRTHALLSGHRTIAHTCISSVTCTPWFISSLNCCTRSVDYSLSNDISSLNCCTRHYLCLLAWHHTSALLSTLSSWCELPSPVLFISLTVSSPPECPEGINWNYIVLKRASKTSPSMLLQQKAQPVHFQAWANHKIFRNLESIHTQKELIEINCMSGKWREQVSKTSNSM